MKTPPNSFRLALIASALSGAWFAPALAAPAADSAYVTDPQQSYVSDKTAEPMQQVNNIMCYMSSMKPAALVNQGPYAALVNDAKCGDDSSNSSNTGVQYKRVIVDSLRTTNDDPMRAKIWVSNDDSKDGDGPKPDIFVNLSASEAPSANNPNGIFRVDYCAPVGDGTCMENGRLEGLATGIRYVETERTSQSDPNSLATLRLFVSRSGDTGTGAVARDVPSSPSDSLTYRFAYDTNYFRRVRDGGEDACFDRSLDHGKTSAFRYGLYDTSGARVDRNSGFPVTTVVNGQAQQGYAGYWGLNFSGNVMASVADGATLTRQSFDNGASSEHYTLSKVAGRLMKYQKQLLPLAGAKNVPISIGLFNGLTDATAAAVKAGANGNSIRGQQVNIAWNADISRFVVVGQMVCDNSGCNSTQLATPVTLTNDDLALYSGGFNGFAQSLGGEVAVPAGVLTAVASNTSALASAALVVRIGDVVYPGSAGAPGSLFCVNSCTTADGLAALAAGSANSPYGNTQNAFMQAASTVAYSYSSGGQLSMGSAAVVWPSELSADQAGMYGQGARTGKLLTSMAAFECANDHTKFCANNADEADLYYVWETGPNPWNQFAGLRGSDGNLVKFDAPLPVSYNVPNRGEFGQYAGTTMRLQYNGFGDLFGIPSSCVNAVTNAPVACGPGQDIRNVSAFTIPANLVDGQLTDADGHVYYAKWLNREVRFAEVAGSFCSALSPGQVASLPPATGLSNPSNPQDPLYIGNKPTVTVAPRVIDGVVKY